MNNKENQIRRILKEEVPTLINFMKETGISKLKIETDKIKIGLGADFSSTKINSSAEIAKFAKKETEIVKSHLVGIFHLSVNEEEESVIKSGDIIEIGQIIGFIESMQVMQEIKSPVSGKIKKILVSESQPVEYGQELILIETGVRHRNAT